MSVALRLSDDIDVSRGNTIVRPQNQPTVSSRFECLMCWMSEEPLSPRRRYLVKHTTRTAMVGKVDVRYRIDVESLRRDESATHARAQRPRAGAPRAELAAGVRLLPAQPRDRQLDRDRRGDQRHGRRGGDPRHGGRDDADGLETEKTERSPNVRWQGTRMTRERRWQALGHSGATLWFTGLPGAGKSTVAAGRGGASARSRPVGVPARRRQPAPRSQRRPRLRRERPARERAAHRARRAAARRVRARSPWSASSARTPPTARRLRRCTTADELGFIEIFVDAPLELCEQRDPKGLYARARAGELAGLTGVGAPYEAPADPDLVLGSREETVEEEVEQVMDAAPRQGPRLARRRPEAADPRRPRRGGLFSVVLLALLLVAAVARAGVGV